MSVLKLGKKPATHDERDLKLTKYLTPALKVAPKGFGHQALVKHWGMLANDTIGDCEIARSMHATMLWNAASGRPVPSFTDQTAVEMYSAVTGYNPDDPDSDQGTNMRDSLRYAQKTGVPDANGGRHKIGAYLSIDPKDTHALLQALYLCDGVAMGFEFPSSAMDQFNAGKPWTVVHGSPIEGGHAVEVVARPSAEGLDVITWGAVQRMGFGFYSTYNDEAWAVISTEALNGQGKTAEGFNLAQLQADLAAL